MQPSSLASRPLFLARAMQWLPQLGLQPPPISSSPAQPSTLPLLSSWLPSIGTPVGLPSRALAMPVSDGHKHLPPLGGGIAGPVDAHCLPHVSRGPSGHKRKFESAQNENKDMKSERPNAWRHDTRNDMETLGQKYGMDLVSCPEHWLEEKRQKVCGRSRDPSSQI